MQRLNDDFSFNGTVLLVFQAFLSTIVPQLVSLFLNIEENAPPLFLEFKQLIVSHLGYCPIGYLQ